MKYAAIDFEYKHPADPGMGIISCSLHTEESGTTSYWLWDPMNFGLSDKAALVKRIKGMMLTQAKKYLKNVVAKKSAVPYKRFTKKVGHRRGLDHAYAGRYPVKAAKYILKLLEGAEANAENKGLDIDRMRIIHAASHQGMKVKRFQPRAQGRASPSFDILVHVEVALEELGEKGEVA